MNALPMLIRCGRHQGGERPGPWALRGTQSSEATWTPAVQIYLPEEAMGGEGAALPEAETEPWA